MSRETVKEEEKLETEILIQNALVTLPLQEDGE